MKSRNYASAFYVLAFILLITPALASAATDSVNPVISSISPQTGKEGDTIIIKGKNFPSLNPDIEIRRYVNFNGFLETEIVDWQPSAIKVKVPPISATQQERQKSAIDIVSELPVVGKFGKYLFEFMPVQVAKAPTKEGVPVPVSVVVPGGESNVVDFTYVNETSDKKVNSFIADAGLLLSIAWQNEVVDPFTHLLHPIKSFTETTQRLGRVIAYSSVQTAHAPSTESTADIATPEKVVSPSNNAAVDKKSSPAVTQTSTQTPKTEAPEAGTKNIIPSKITARITDQYGNAYLGKNFDLNQWNGGKLDFEVDDALGERVGNATIMSGWLESGTLPAGKYTIAPIGMGYAETPVIVNTITLPPEGIYLGTLVINRWGTIKFRAINEVGTSLEGVNARMTTCEITDEYVKNQPRNVCWSQTNLLFDSGRWTENNGTVSGQFPTGNYTLTISRSGYESAEKSFSVNNRDVDLGTIVLKKK